MRTRSGVFLLLIAMGILLICGLNQFVSSQSVALGRAGPAAPTTHSAPNADLKNNLQLVSTPAERDSPPGALIGIAIAAFVGGVGLTILSFVRHSDRFLPVVSGLLLLVFPSHAFGMQQVASVNPFRGSTPEVVWFGFGLATGFLFALFQQWRETATVLIPAKPSREWTIAELSGFALELAVVWTEIRNRPTGREAPRSVLRHYAAARRYLLELNEPGAADFHLRMLVKWLAANP